MAVYALDVIIHKQWVTEYITKTRYSFLINHSTLTPVTLRL